MSLFIDEYNCVVLPSRRLTSNDDHQWDEGVIGMSLGEVAKIHCTPDYAYGAGGFPAWGIMPNSELVFEIEVLSFQ